MNGFISAVAIMACQKSAGSPRRLDDILARKPDADRADGCEIPVVCIKLVSEQYLHVYIFIAQDVTSLYHYQDTP